MTNRDTRELDLSDIIEEVGSQVELKLPEHEDRFGEAPTPIPRSLRQLGRYRSLYKLGKGGMGQIVAADDPWLNRHVALKLVHGGLSAEERRLHRFTREAQVTAQLEHPNIVPVYDMGADEDGQIFFAMRRVSGLSLAEVVSSLAADDPATTRRFSRPRLLGIFQRVCQAVSYAHSRGVIHRDLKPDNVMIGEHGEVYVMDWGLCRVIGARVGEETARINLPDPLLDGSESSAEGFQGTPMYMAPEELSKSSRRGSIAGDVYSLGAILYELLTWQPVHQVGTFAELLARATIGEIAPLRARAPERGIPEALETLCLRALHREPERRHPSARALHDDVERFLEGRAEEERRDKAATSAVQAGMKESLVFEKLLQRQRDAELELYLARLRTGSDGQTTGYDEVYRLARSLESLEADAVDSLTKAARRFEEALSHRPDHGDARALLARLYWSRFNSAEQRGERNDARYFRRLVETYDDGQLEAPMAGEGVLRLATNTRKARATIQEFVDQGGVLSLSAERDLGETPIEIKPIAMGSYLVTLRSDGYGTTRVPILVERQARPHVTVRLRTDAEVGQGFVHVPGGPFVIGGDRLNPVAGPRRVEIVSDFAIAQLPVTTGQYLEFVNDLASLNGTAARSRVPRGDNGEPLWPQTSEGHFTLPQSEEAGLAWHPACPVTHVS